MKLLLITLLTLFISNCGDKVREEITDRYDDGKKKTIMKFKGSGSEEVMVEKISYSQSGDTLIWENYDSKGERDGKWIGYVDDYFVKGNYKDGGKDGKWTFYYENGQIKLEENYKDDKLDGKGIWYYENGQIQLEKNYKDGKEDGISTFYRENGQIRKESNYKDGKKSGKWIWYYENGQIRKESNYKDGKEVK